MGRVQRVGGGLLWWWRWWQMAITGKHDEIRFFLKFYNRALRIHPK